MKRIIYTLFISVLMTSMTIHETKAQGSFEAGVVSYLNRSDNFHYFASYGNSYYIGVSPFIGYTYQNKSSFRFGASLSLYDLGSYFDISPIPSTPIRGVEPVALFEDQLIDLGLVIGYQIKINERFSVVTSLSGNIFFTNFYGNVVTSREVYGVKKTDDYTIHYSLVRSGYPDIAAGYTSSIDLMYKLWNKLNLILGMELKGSFTTMVKYEMAYGFHPDVEYDPQHITSTGSISNDNDRYGIKLGLAYRL